jgi:hypothetical protein
MPRRKCGCTLVADSPPNPRGGLAKRLYRMRVALSLSSRHVIPYVAHKYDCHIGEDFMVNSLDTLWAIWPPVATRVSDVCTLIVGGDLKARTRARRILLEDERDVLAFEALLLGA